MGHKALKYTAEAFRWCSGILIGLTVVLNFIAVIMRYVLNNPIMWCEEISLFMFVSAISFAIVPMTYSRRAVKLDFFIDLASPMIQHISQIIADMCSGIALGTVAILGISLIIRTKYRFTPILNIPYKLVYATTVVGMTVAAIMFICHAIKDIRNLANNTVENLK